MAARGGEDSKGPWGDERRWRSGDDLDNTIGRLQAYAEAGANVLFAPGLRSLDQIRAVVEAVARPVKPPASPRRAARSALEPGVDRRVPPRTRHVVSGVAAPQLNY